MLDGCLLSKEFKLLNPITKYDKDDKLGIKQICYEATVEGFFKKENSIKLKGNLVIKNIFLGHSVIIFCPSRKWAENVDFYYNNNFPFI